MKLSQKRSLILYVVAIQLVATISGVITERVGGFKYKDDAKFDFPYLITFLKALIVLVSAERTGIVVKKIEMGLLGLIGFLMYINELIGFKNIQVASFRTVQVCGTLRLVPILTLKYLLFGESVSSDLVNSCIITTLGSILFLLDFSKFGTIVPGSFTLPIKYYGIPLTLVNHGVYNCLQDYVFKTHEVSSSAMILYTNIFRITLSFVQTLSNREMLFGFVRANPVVIVHILSIVILGALTQRLVYACIKDHGTIVVNYIGITRKILSIVVSSIYFGHTLRLNHFIGMIFIGLGVYYLVESKKKKILDLKE